MSENVPELIYTPESQLRHPRQLFRNMWMDLKNSRGLAWRLTVRDISAQYRQTALGYFWAVFPPLVTSLTFILLNSSKIIDVRDIEIPYPAFVFFGTVFWQLFVDALNAPLKVVTNAKMMLAKINFPKEALILSGIGQILFSFGIKLIMLALVLLFFKIPIKWTVLFVPIPILGLVALGTMLGVLLVPIGVLYKDIQSSLLIATSALIFFTPVVYPPPEAGMLSTVMKFNPVTPMIMTTRQVAYQGIPHNLVPFCLTFFATLVLIFIGWIMYRIAMPILVERMSA